MSQPLILELSEESYNIASRMPKLDLMEMVFEVPELKDLGFEESYEKIHSLLNCVVEEHNEQEEFTIKELAKWMAIKFAEQNGIPIKRSPRIDFEFFGVFNSDTRFWTASVHVLALRARIARTSHHTSNNEEWSATSFMAAMTQVILPPSPTGQFFEFLLGYMTSTIYGSFLALIKHFRTESISFCATLQLPSVERFRLKFFNGEPIGESAEHAKALMKKYHELAALASPSSSVVHPPIFAPPLMSTSSTGASPNSSSSSLKATPSPTTAVRRRRQPYKTIPRCVKEDLLEFYLSVNGRIVAKDYKFLAEKWKNETMTEFRVKGWFRNNRKTLKDALEKKKKEQ